MKFIVKGKNIRVTKALKEHAQKKFSKLDEFFENIVNATLELEVEKGAKGDQHKAHIVIKLPKHILLKGESKTDDMYKTIDDLEAKMATAIKRQHEKFKHHKVKPEKNILKRVLANIVPEPSVSEDILITVDKRFSIKPMDPIEAVLQLSKTKLKFYAFHNTKVHHKLNVVYERSDGTYGLQTFKKDYIKKAHLKGFKNKPLGAAKGVKITKIKDISTKIMVVEKAAANLTKKPHFHFLPFTNAETGYINILYKAGEKKIKLIEPTITS